MHPALRRPPRSDLTPLRRLPNLVLHRSSPSLSNLLLARSSFAYNSTICILPPPFHPHNPRATYDSPSVRPTTTFPTTRSVSTANCSNNAVPAYAIDDVLATRSTPQPCDYRHDDTSSCITTLAIPVTGTSIQTSSAQSKCNQYGIIRFVVYEAVPDFDGCMEIRRCRGAGSEGCVVGSWVTKCGGVKNTSWMRLLESRVVSGGGEASRVGS